MPYSILQYGDFYSSLTSVWLTALIVADPMISQSICSTLSLAGVVGIAVAVHYNPTSLPTFIVPIVCGLFLIITSWVLLSWTSFWLYDQSVMGCCCPDPLLLPSEGLLSWSVLRLEGYHTVLDLLSGRSSLLRLSRDGRKLLLRSLHLAHFDRPCHRFHPACV